MLLLAAASQGIDWLQWTALVAVPTFASVMGFLGYKTYGNARAAKDSSREAADFVRPNGTGHQTQTAMIEDVLLHLGELRGSVKNLDGKVVTLSHTVDDRSKSFDKLEVSLKSLDKRVTEIANGFKENIKFSEDQIDKFNQSSSGFKFDNRPAHDPPEAR